MDHAADTALGRWSAPECLFQIEYSTRVLDDIRLAVVDAFFSLPRGGAEIGGILLGTHKAGLITITGYEALDCEHAMGPSFTLSPRDQTLLAEMLAKAASNPANRQPVGWYHSHTRSEIFLSETDQDIHKRFFPELWQIALVLKPHTFEPTRGGFFFRDANGSMRGSASYQEFVIDPLPMQKVPSGGGNGAPANHRPLHEDSVFRINPVTKSQAPAAMAAAARPVRQKGRVPITREIAIEPPLEDGEDVPEAKEIAADEFDVPQFALQRQERSWRVVKVFTGLAIVLTLAATGYQTRQYWMPQAMAKVRAVLPKEPDAYLSLTVSDSNGQLNIQWDKNAPAVRNAVEGVLEITDGKTVPRFVRLDGAHLTTGIFSYVRENEQVDVALNASLPSGQTVREQTSFLGKLPGAKAEDPAVRRERDELAQKADKLQKDLTFQASKTKKLEKDLKDMKDQMTVEQRRRLASQAADPEKKQELEKR